MSPRTGSSHTALQPLGVADDRHPETVGQVSEVTCPPHRASGPSSAKAGARSASPSLSQTTTVPQPRKRDAATWLAWLL